MRESGTEKKNLDQLFIRVNQYKEMGKGKNSRQPTDKGGRDEAYDHNLIRREENAYIGDIRNAGTGKSVRFKPVRRKDGLPMRKRYQLCFSKGVHVNEHKAKSDATESSHVLRWRENTMDAIMQRKYFFVATHPIGKGSIRKLRYPIKRKGDNMKNIRDSPWSWEGVHPMRARNNHLHRLYYRSS